MADPKGFLTTSREVPKTRPVDVRILDWKEVYQSFPHATLEEQAGRCMDCGIPFCHNGCPLGNLIPEWNDLVWRHDWREAAERLHATNNFPEVTGRLCPAPCESACVLAIDPTQTTGAVTIKQVEHEIADRAWDDGWVTPQVPGRQTGKTVAVVGSGPAGLAAAQQLTRAGHTVVVFERADRIGGLLRYGIPEFKMEKSVLDRRLAQMSAEGTRFRPGVEIGVDMTARELKSRYDAVVLAIGATAARDLPIEGRALGGIHQAMEYLPIANRVQQGDLAEPTITAAGKHVVIIGGGDTGADCLGTAHRQGAATVTQLEILPHVQAVVCHAGHNTVCEALANGLPLVVAPIRDDQPVVAQQVVRAGAGTRVRYGHLSPHSLRNAVVRVLAEPNFRGAAARIRDSFDAAGGAPAAADALEAMA